jgi:hypothetical protein
MALVPEFMEPLEISPGARLLVEPYPTGEVLREALLAMPDAECESFLRSWTYGGIPFAFRQLPMLYESIREWISAELSLTAEMVVLIGSGRMGYSTAPAKFGRVFGRHSDFDWSLIDHRLFEEICGDFANWKSDVTDGTAVPSNEREAAFWKDNLMRLPGNIERGFVDSLKVPVRYPTASRVEDLMFRLLTKLKALAGTPVPLPGASNARVYSDGEAFREYSRLSLDKTREWLNQVNR